MPDDDLTLEECRQALLAAARVVSRFPEYLPLYERMEREFIARRDTVTVMQRALRLSATAPKWH